MDNQRLLIFVVFAMSLYFLFAGYQEEQAKLRQPATIEQTNEVPAPGAPLSALPDGKTPTPPVVETELKAQPEVPSLTITTDLYKAEISPLGGVIKRMALLKQPAAVDVGFVEGFTNAIKKLFHVGEAHDAVPHPYLAFESDPAGRFLVAQTGLAGGNLPNHYTTYQVLSQQRELKDGEESFRLVLGATAPNGDQVQQILTFKRGSYVIDVTMKVTNKSAEPLTPTAYFQFTRDTKEAAKRNAMAPSAYIGPALYDETDKFKKVDFKTMDNLARNPAEALPYQARNDNGWIAMLEHYFVTAWALPESNTTEREFFTRSLKDGKYSAGMMLSLGTIQPGATADVTVPLYAGPQDQDTLKALAPNLNMVVDYGIFTIIAAPMFWLINLFFNWIGNWGWAIICMTLVIRIVFFPLNASAARSMAKMRLVGPKMKAIQEEFKEDKQQMQARLMELYKSEKINPLGGCLPILVQMPFFIALYWVLLSAAELRFAPWMGWIQDLSQPDPLLILPALYALSAYLQMKLSPTPVTDPAQARMMQMIPVIFAVLFIFFPSGLVLYWFVSNLFQIGQQWYINRKLEHEAKPGNKK
jgi:YidC/Oxa1 family membrane protein insertase